MGKSAGTGKSAAVVIDGHGRRMSLGDLIDLLVSRSPLPITRIAEAAGVSRSFFYLLRDDKQIPSLESLVSLLAACETGEVRLAEGDEPGEIVVTTDTQTYYIHLSSTRSRQASSALRSSKTPSFDGGEGGSAWPPAPTSAGDPWALGTTAPAYADSDAPAPSSRSGRFGLARHGGRERLLGELLDAAGGLDAERRQLLIEHARLLRRSGG